MPRGHRIVLDGLVHHVLNRGNRKATLFFDHEDYQHFIELMVLATSHVRVAIIAFALMRNHWHLVLRPAVGRELSAYMQRLSTAHVSHFRQRYGGVGHVYQGRYKCFPVEHEANLLRLLRYVESNALRAGLVARAEDWRWCSLSDHRSLGVELTPSPVARPPNWLEILNGSQPAAELEQLRHAVNHGTPFGQPAWVRQTAIREGLLATTRPAGRPRKYENGDSPRFSQNRD